MRTVVVDDDPIMLRCFRRMSEGIGSIQIDAEFQTSKEALAYVKEHPAELVILDISMPGMSGIEFAKILREIRSSILIVFITAYDEYIRDSNEVGADDYIVKPYRRETIEQMADRMNFLVRRQEKAVFIQTFGCFRVLADGKPVSLPGKAKEILALIVTRRGREISNEEIYSTIWEGRPSGNDFMAVYYNALKRLKCALDKVGLVELLISAKRGQSVNTELFDCDFYDWQDKKERRERRFAGEFLPEYSWAEAYLADMMEQYRKTE